MKKIHTTLLFNTLLLLCNCQEEKIILTPIKGSLQGFVKQQKEVFRGTLTGLSEVTISVEGTDPLIIVTSGGDGKYAINDLPMGTYNLIFEKPGYGTYKIQGYSFMGGEIPNYLSAVVMYELPEVEITDVEIIVSKQGSNIRIAGNITASLLKETSDIIFFRYYLSTTPDVNPNTYTDSGILDSYISKSNSPPTFYLFINDKKYPGGSILYIIIYPCADDSGYIDINTGKTIYPSIGKKGSEIMSFQIPV